MTGQNNWYKYISTNDKKQLFDLCWITAAALINTRDGKIHRFTLA